MLSDIDESNFSLIVEHEIANATFHIGIVIQKEIYYEINC